MINTLTFDESVNGWTSFFGYFPEFMTGLNGRFFTFRNGDIWQHNSKDVPYNNFFGEQFTSKVALILNDHPSTEKMFKNLFLEGNKTWLAVLKSNLTNGHITREEFQKKKSRFFAFTRRNEDIADTTSFSTNGIGNVKTITGNILTFNHISDMIGVGDKLTQMQSSIAVEIGIIDSINRESGEIGFAVLDNPPSLNEFCYATKDARVEGGEMRGYFMRVDLENDDTDFTELFAINSNTAETYV